MTERLDALRARLRQEVLERGGVPRDADELLADALGRSTGWMFAHGEEPVDESLVRAALERRLSGEPLQYIRGRADFYGREFLVDSRVLIPRPETELLVEQVVLRATRNGRVIDVGSGSGCIAITIERERPDLAVTSVDLSVEALSIATTNARRLDSHARFAASDVLSAIDATFDIIVSNPPYIGEGAVAHLQTEVRAHEPMVALTPGPRGTEVIERLLDQARSLLAPGGLILLEIGYGQATAVRTLATVHGFETVAILPDLAGIPRVAILTR